MKQKLKLCIAKMMTEEEAMNWKNLIFWDLLLWLRGQRTDLENSLLILVPLSVRKRERKSARK